MNKKKGWILLITIVLVACIIAVIKLASEGKIRTGTPEHDLIALKNGSYTLSDFALKPGEYAMYAVAGSGTVDIDGQKYNLNSQLFLDIQKRSGPAFYSVLYEESPKVMLSDRTIITLNGDESFEISFLRR